MANKELEAYNTFILLLNDLKERPPILPECLRHQTRDEPKLSSRSRSSAVKPSSGKTPVNKKTRRSPAPSKDKESLTTLDIYNYIYAVLHSSAYRESYRNHFKIDSPRIPYPIDEKTFSKLISLGGELRHLHLQENKKFEKIDIESALADNINNANNTKVEKVDYSDGKVFINKDFYFDKVPKSTWDFFIGTNKPAQKWLHDRLGHTLHAKDIRHYRIMVLALTETARVMETEGRDEQAATSPTDS